MSDKKDTKKITVKKEQDTALWYEEVCLKSELGDFGPVRGTIVIRPRGFYIWEQIQEYFKENILKKHDVENAYFPLFIPETYFTKEADHARGFAPELAWIATANDDEDLQKEKAIIRPTSETIILESFKKWLRNYKQLPMKINQWANVVRWEVKQTKLFLRSREFLWQEGHCMYQTNEECEQEVQEIIAEYATMCKDLLALPTLVGEKTPAERFAGANRTFTIESFMPDGKAVQMGTSHNLGTNFSKGFGIEFKDADGTINNPYTSSWGVSTRLLGATVMMHSDDNGLVLPPKLLKQKVVIIPMFHKNNKDEIMNACYGIAKSLKLFGAFVDDREEYSMGWKLGEWELKGTAAMLILGGRELEQNQITLKMRDQEDKRQISIAEIKNQIDGELSQMHERLYTVAKDRLDETIVQVNSLDEFKKVVENGQIAKALFCCEKECEADIEEKYLVGSRCLAENKVSDNDLCLFSQKPAKAWVYFSKSY